MSDLDLRPQEYLCAGRVGGGPEELLLTARRVYLGKTTEVAPRAPRQTHSHDRGVVLP